MEEEEYDEGTSTSSSSISYFTLQDEKKYIYNKKEIEKSFWKNFCVSVLIISVLYFCVLYFWK